MAQLANIEVNLLIYIDIIALSFLVILNTGLETDTCTAVWNTL